MSSERHGRTDVVSDEADLSSGGDQSDLLDGASLGSAAAPTDPHPGVHRVGRATTPAGTDGHPARLPRYRTRGDYVRAFVRGIGQTMVTLGLVVLLFVVYELWVTNIYAHARQVQAKHTLARAWKDHHDPLKGVDRAKLPAGKQVILPAGQGFANLYIPRLGKDYAYTIVEGTTEEDLARGPGHYDAASIPGGSAIPGQIGDFAVAGHRVTHGQPFLNADQIKAGDAIVVQTDRNWYVYRVLGNAKTGNLATRNGQGVPGREIVDPSDTAVVAPVPDHPGVRPTIAYMTMTTCNPKYSANQRMVIHSVLARTVKASGSGRPRELGGTL